MKNAKQLLTLILATLVTAACGMASAASQDAPPPPAEPTLAPTDAPVPEAECPVTPAVIKNPPDDPNADPFGNGPWVINADETIWTSPRGWTVGGNKTIWIRQPGDSFTISGQRLDGDSPPLEATIPDGYYTGFQIAGVTFPTAGCWQVTATAGESQLDFVVEVH